MGRVIRKAETADLPAIMVVLEAAKGIMRASGNLHQWTGGYPSEETILKDISEGSGQVVADDGKVVGYFAFIPSPEPTYSEIFGGSWLKDEPYHVVHRIGSLPEVHGVFRSIMDWCFANDPDIRIDTHRDNSIMRHNILKYGFRYCGIIYLASGDERLAYQKIDETVKQTITMTLEQQIQEDIKAAMKAKDNVSLAATRAIKGEILLFKTAEGGSKEVTDGDIMKMAQKLIKQRKEAAEQYVAAGRQELADNELAEAAVIEKYLPKQLSAEEVEARIKEIIAQTGATSIKDMGKVMGIATKALAGQTDGKTISGIVKSLLG